MTLGKPLWRDETLADQLLRPPFEILEGQRRREVTLAGRRRREVTLAGQAPTRAELRPTAETGT